MIKNILVQLNEDDYKLLQNLVVAHSVKYKGVVTRSAFIRYLIRSYKDVV